MVCSIAKLNVYINLRAEIALSSPSTQQISRSGLGFAHLLQFFVGSLPLFGLTNADDVAINRPKGYEGHHVDALGRTFNTVKVHLAAPYNLPTLGTLVAARLSPESDIRISRG